LRRDTAALLAAHGYIADLELATTVHLALAMRRPLLLEGEPGTGKTEIAKVLAAGLRRRLVRLQCYDGMDLSAAAYEWDHRAPVDGDPPGRGRGHTDRDELARDIYTREFLQARPLLSAIDPDLPPAVLLIDELDRADEPFEAFLLELLADFQITCAGTRHGAGEDKAGGGVDLEPHARGARRDPPALPVSLGGLPRRRARAGDPGGKAPGVPEKLAAQVVAFRAAAARRGTVQAAGRGRDDRLGCCADASELARTDAGVVDETLGVLLKYQDDIAKIRGAEAARLVGEVAGDGAVQIGADR
jgi:hypothetical protein